jgi:hypothetical protein
VLEAEGLLWVDQCPYPPRMDYTRPIEFNKHVARRAPKPAPCLIHLKQLWTFRAFGCIAKSVALGPIEALRIAAIRNHGHMAWERTAAGDRQALNWLTLS